MLEQRVNIDVVFGLGASLDDGDFRPGHVQGRRYPERPSLHLIAWCDLTETKITKK